MPTTTCLPTRTGHRRANLGAAMLLSTLTGPLAAQSLTDEEALGQAIFFDESLSLNRNQSCASCHAPEAGWTGPDSEINLSGAVYEGSLRGLFGNRKPPSSAYATPSPILHIARPGAGRGRGNGNRSAFTGGNFWDGRATGEKLGNPAADQAQGPFLNPVEQALPDSACVVYRVCENAAYPVPAADVWGAGACDIVWPTDVDTVCADADGTVALADDDAATAAGTYDLIALAIAAYEDSPASNAYTSKFDYYLAGLARLEPEEMRGLQLFRGKARCARCHSLAAGPNGGPPLLTDYSFDNLGIPRNPDNPVYSSDPDWVDPGLGGFLATRPDYERYAAANAGAQKVPTLRNVAKGADSLIKAYGHNGYFKDLWQIVHFYNTRDAKPVCDDALLRVEEAIIADCWPEPEVAANVNTGELGDLRLSTAQERALVAFMRTLSDGYTPTDE